MKAVIPAAGRGLRFLPLSKELPKEIMPVVDRPTIQYVVEEAVDAGIEDIIVVTGRGKGVIEDHFDRSPELEAVLESSGKWEELDAIRKTSQMADIHYVRQKAPRGLGDAVYCARRHVGDEFFSVMLADIINISEVPVVEQLIRVHEEYDCSVIAVQTIPERKIEEYGIIAGERIADRLFRVDDMVEKPSLEEAPSSLGITGTYVLSPTVFRCIERVGKGREDEVQLTDALRSLSTEEQVLAYEIEADRYDIGDRLGWLKANMALGLSHQEFSEPLRAYLNNLLSR